MPSVEIISKKSFSINDSEILDRFVEFQKALIDKDLKKLDEIILDDYELIHMSGKKQSKKEFIGEVGDGTLNYYESKILNPTIIHDGDTASLIADVTLNACVYGNNGVWTLNTVADFKKIDGEWYFGKWGN